MEIRTEKKLVERDVYTYIAEDGKEFDTKVDCENYEREIEDARLRAGAERFEIKELEDTYPLDVDGQYISDNHSYKWYKVKNEEELKVVAEVYNRSDDWNKLKAYPEVICVEYDDYWDNDAWMYLLSDMKKATDSFWRKHGFEVEFKER